MFSLVLGLGIYCSEMLFSIPQRWACEMLQGYAESLICIYAQLNKPGAAFGIFRGSA